MGVYDIRKDNANARNLHDYIKDFVASFENTNFLFDSICTISMKTDKFSCVNDCINEVNEYLLKLSLRVKNFKPFNNLCFVLSHL